MGNLFASLACLAQQPGTLRWRFNAGNRVISSPALGADGMIYVGCGSRPSGAIPGGAFYCVSPQGATNWVFYPGAPVTASPAIGADGTIYVACDNGKLYALTPTGATNWVFQAGGQYLSSPALGVDGTLYVACLSTSYSSNRLYSIRADGTTNWVFAMGRSLTLGAPDSSQFPSPSIGRDGTVYVGCLDGHVYAVSPGGKTKWVVTLGASNSTYSSPTVGPDGTLYVGSDLGRVYALSPGGTTNWSYATGSFVESSASLSASGTTLYIGSLDHNLYALGWNATGSSVTKLWAASVGMVSSSAAVGTDGTLYVTTLGPNSICALSAGGAVRWTFTLPDYAFSSPVLGPDGTVYAGGATSLYALYGTNALASTPWAMFRRDPGHQARAVQCRLGAPQPLPDGNLALNLTVETNLSYTVQVSSNLHDWAALTNFSSSTCSPQVSDLDATNFARRYYRLRTP